MRQAVLYVTPSWRSTSLAATPFREAQNWNMTKNQSRSGVRVRRRGMANMRNVMPALQKAKPAVIGDNGLHYLSASLPSQQRQTRVAKDMSLDAIAQELVEWIGAE